MLFLCEQAVVKGLEKREVINAQFIKYWDIRLRYSEKKIAERQYRKELWGLLGETLPKCRKIKVDCVLTEYEREVVRMLGWTADVEGGDAIYIEEIIKTQYRKLCGDDALVCFFPEYYTVLARCIGRFARLKCDYEESQNVLDDILGQFYFLENDFRLGSIFIQRFQLHEDMRKAQRVSPAQDNDEYFQDVRYAYAINKLYLRDDICAEFIESYIDRHYGNKDEIFFRLM